MALTASPPRYPSYGAMLKPIVRGSEPWAVYALQRAVGVSPATGVFGPQTLRKVKAFQAKYGLVVDGIAGPHREGHSTTQGTILELAGIVADRDHGLPEGVGFGFATAEGGGVLAATNWQITGAVDCGPAQWRIPGPPFSLAALKRAFRPYIAIDHACAALKARQVEFMDRNHFWADTREALSVAVLAHNWPVGADAVVRTYRGSGAWWRFVPSPDEPASWVEGFTHSEWAREYVKRILTYVAS